MNTDSCRIGFESVNLRVYGLTVKHFLDHQMLFPSAKYFRHFNMMSLFNPLGLFNCFYGDYKNQRSDLVFHRVSVDFPLIRGDIV